MIRRTSILTVLLIALTHSFAQTANYEAAEKYDAHNLQKNVGSLEVLPFFINKSDKFWFQWEDAKGNKDRYLIDPSTKQKRLLYDKKTLAEKLSALSSEKVDQATFNFMPSFSNDDKMNFNYRGKNYCYDFYKNVLTEIQTEKKQLSEWEKQVGKLSPAKQYIVYSRSHNLFLKEKGIQTEIKMSNDGEPYYSFNINESDTSNRINPTNVNWLPGSKHFYVVRQDNRKMQTISLVHTMSARPWVETKKYQFPGDKDVTQYELWIGNVKTGQLKRVDLSKWPDQELVVVNAKESSKEIFVTRKKRTNDEIELCAVNIETGAVRVIINEACKPHINSELFSVLVINKGREFIWWSDRTGWGHYYLYDSTGKLKSQITTGNWTAGKIVFTDTARRELFIYGYGKEEGRNPYLQHLYKVSFNGKEQQLLTPENAHHKIYFSPSGKYFVDNYSRIDLDPKTILRGRGGNFVCDVATADISELYKLGWKKPEPFVVKAADGITDLYGIMWKPYDFDSAKKYPLISQVYPGPFIETVWSDFTVFDKYNNTSLAQVGFIVVVMGHRGGSPLRNKAYFNYGYGNLRDYPLADDKYGLQQLYRRFSFIDSNRIGIFGHSGGGAMAVAAICTYPDFYKVAVASSGNHDNNIYFRSWGEKFQGISEIKDSITGKTSFRFKVQTNQSIVKNLKGHLLLVTGEVDDNVHPANTFRLVDALIKAGKDFDMLVLPNQNHHYEGVYKTFFEIKLRHYFGKYLIGK